MLLRVARRTVTRNRLFSSSLRGVVPRPNKLPARSRLLFPKPTRVVQLKTPVTFRRCFASIPNSNGDDTKKSKQLKHNKLTNKGGQKLDNTLAVPAKPSLWQRFKREVLHYYNGTRLLAIDVGTSFHLIKRVLYGYSLSRRERKQLTRTTTDLLRLVPFSVFIIIPFMEVFLPVALRYAKKNCLRSP